MTNKEIKLQYEKTDGGKEYTETFGGPDQCHLTGTEIRTRAFERYNQLKREGRAVSIVTDT